MSFFLSRWFVCMACQNPLCVIVMLFSPLLFGVNFFAWMVLSYHFLLLITLNLMDRSRWLIALLRCTSFVWLENVLNARLIGFHGLNTATTPPFILPFALLPSGLCMDGILLICSPMWVGLLGWMLWTNHYLIEIPFYVMCEPNYSKLKIAWKISMTKATETLLFTWAPWYGYIYTLTAKSL